MLYLIGGASRTVKTLMAKQLSSQMGIPYLSLDWIMMGFKNGIPEYGVHDKLFPNDIAKRLWPFYKAMFESMIAVDTMHNVYGLLTSEPDAISVKTGKQLMAEKVALVATIGG
ncbi:MAG: hypothetical protein AAF717_04590 [Bacteroidota bacterium]